MTNFISVNNKLLKFFDKFNISFFAKYFIINFVTLKLYFMLIECFDFVKNKFEIIEF